MTNERDSAPANEQTVREYLLSPQGANLNPAEVEAVEALPDYDGLLREGVKRGLNAQRIGDAVIRQWRLDEAHTKRVAAEREHFEVKGFKTADEWVAALRRANSPAQTDGGSSGGTGSPEGANPSSPSEEASGQPSHLPDGLLAQSPGSATVHVTMSNTRAHGRRCVHVDVPPEACYVRFSSTKVENTDYVGHTTARGEMMIFDYDAEGRIVGIELVGDGDDKPCQKNTRDDCP